MNIPITDQNDAETSIDGYQPLSEEYLLRPKQCI